MIKITVEIVPFGIVKDTRKVWEIEVINVHTNKNNLADYQVFWSDKEHSQVAYLEMHKHQRVEGLARLLAKVFRKMDKEL